MENNCVFSLKARGHWLFKKLLCCLFYFRLYVEQIVMLIGTCDSTPCCGEVADAVFTVLSW